MIRDFLQNLALRFLGDTRVFSTFNKYLPPDRNLSGFLKAYRGWVYAAVSAIAEDFAAVDIRLYQRTRRGDVVDVSNMGLKPMEVLRRVNDFMTFGDLREIHSVYMDLTGRSFWYVPLSKNGEPMEILPLPVHRMQVVGDDRDIIGGYVYTNPKGERIPFDANEIIFFRRIDPLNPFSGAYGPAFAADISIDTWEYASKWNKNFFFNSAMPEGVLVTDKNLTKEQFDRLKDEWNSKYGGIDNARRVALLQGGLDFKPITLSPRDMDFAQLKREMRDEILGVFRVPRTVVGITDDVNRANAEATDYVFSKRVIKPRVSRFVDHLNEYFLPKFKMSGDYFFGFIDPVPEDLDKKYRNYQIGVTSGFLAPNEAREQLGFGPVDGGDTVYQPMNLMPIGKVKSTKGFILAGKKSATKPVKKLNISPDEARSVIGKKRRFIAQAARKHEKFLKKYFSDQRDWLIKKLEGYKQSEGKALVRKGFESELIDFIFGTGEWQKWVKLLLNPTEEFVKSIVAKGGNEALDEVGVEASFNVKNPEVLSWIKKYAAHDVSLVDETTKNMIREVIYEAADLGLGPDDVAARLMDVYDGFSKYRALRIARTETARAYSEGSLFGYKQSGVVKQVQWLTAQDALVCPECQANADQGAINLGSSFSSGHKNPPAHPNCRCALVPVVE